MADSTVSKITNQNVKFTANLQSVYSTNQLLLSKAKKIYEPVMEKFKSSSLAEITPEELDFLEKEIKDMLTRIGDAYKRMQEYRKPQTNLLEMVIQEFKDFENVLMNDNGKFVHASDKINTEKLRRGAIANQNTDKTSDQHAEQVKLYSACVKHISDNLIHFIKQKKAKINEKYVSITKKEDFEERKAAMLDFQRIMTDYKLAIHEQQLMSLKDDFIFNVVHGRKEDIAVQMQKALDDSTDTLITAYNNQMNIEKQRMLHIIETALGEMDNKLIVPPADENVAVVPNGEPILDSSDTVIKIPDTPAIVPFDTLVVGALAGTIASEGVENRFLPATPSTENIATDISQSKEIVVKEEKLTGPKQKKERKPKASKPKTDKPKRKPPKKKKDKDEQPKID